MYFVQLSWVVSCPFGVVKFMKYYTLCISRVQPVYYSLRNNLLRAFPVSSRFTTVYEYPTLCLYGVQPVYYSLWNNLFRAFPVSSRFTKTVPKIVPNSTQSWFRMSQSSKRIKENRPVIRSLWPFTFLLQAKGPLNYLEAPNDRKRIGCRFPDDHFYDF